MTATVMNWRELNKHIGNIDIYWLDFILKGYLQDDARILDVGCGEGRNLIYCMKQGYDVFGIDKDELSIQYIRHIAKSLKIKDYEGRFQLMNASKLIFPDQSFDVVLSSAVFHFANSIEQFISMLEESIRVLKPGGYLVIRSMTTHFLSKDEQKKVKHNIYTFGNGERRFLIDNDIINQFTSDWGMRWVEPFKYVVIENKRSMGTFILVKSKA